MWILQEALHFCPTVSLKLLQVSSDTKIILLSVQKTGSKKDNGLQDIYVIKGTTYKKGERGWGFTT